MAHRQDRPRFFEGQFLGAADLEALVGYARDLGREHALAAHAWGIAIGLALVEVPQPSGGGGVDYFIEPGLAWDGYGRPILVLAPVQVPLDRFAGLPSGHQAVWLRYDETPFSGLREGFATCGAEEAFARIRESVAVEVGPFAVLRERQGGITIAGAPVADARLALRAVNAAAPMLCDGSVPHQAFPASDRARWLVPVGVANWQSGLPGGLLPRSAEGLKLSRTQRRMVGAVAESVYAADGVLRLRDRLAQFKDGDSADALCAAGALKPEDLIDEPDRDDSSKTTGRLISRELVWVEGNLRATGQVRLFGTRLELRDAAGAEAGDAPLYARRAVSANNPAAGQDFQVVIGATGDGKDRLAVGTAPADYGALTERLVLRSDGVLAAGTSIPNDLKTHHVVFAQPDGPNLALAAGAGKAATLAFARLPALDAAAQLAYDDAAAKLRLGVGADLAHHAYFGAAGQVGLGTDAPEAAHPDADDLVLRTAANGGVTLLGGPGSLGGIHFADGVAGPAEQRAGFLRYDHDRDRMQVGTADAVRATLDAGGLGLGTDTPAARIDIREAASGRALKLNTGSAQAEDGGAPTRLDLQPNGGGARFHANAAASARAALTGDGRLGLGVEAPVADLHVAKPAPDLRLDITGGAGAASLDFAVAGAVRSAITFEAGTGATAVTNDGVRTLTLRQASLGVNLPAGAGPVANLHVRGSRSEAASDLGAHVAVIENLAGSNADVLALRVGSAAPDDGNNFITFFDANGPIGRIERSATPAGSDPASGGNFLRLLSGGADFAECLPRAEGVAPIGPGRVVGVRAGRVSLETARADALLVTTARAVVVGNAPLSGEGRAAASVETVAMLGQVRLETAGPPARAGDFVLPSGLEDGRGRAVAPAALLPADAGRVLGRAWADQAPGETSVLVAVGVQGADAQAALAAALGAQQRVIEGLSAELAALRARLPPAAPR